MSDLPTGRISNLRVWFAELLCKPLAVEIARLTTRVEGLESARATTFQAYQEALVAFSTDLNDLRNQVTQHPAPPPPPNTRVARTWQEFRTAAESRKPKEQKS